MLTHSHDRVTLYPDYAPCTSPTLLFVCRTQGEESAIPRVMHKHDDRLEIMFIASGSGQYQIGGRQYLAQEGDILVFNQGVVHDERPHVSEDSLIYSFGITDLQINGLPANHLIGADQSPLIASGSQRLTLQSLFDTLCSQVFDDQPHNGVVTHHLLNATVVLCRNLCNLREQTQQQSETSLGWQIKTLLDDRYREPLKLEAIAGELGITRFYLIHLFKRYSGYSPKQYIIRRRVGEAQSLLVNTDLDVTTIAGRVGYDSMNNFYRVFKIVVGIPPTQYKNRWLQGSDRAVTLPEGECN